MTRPRATISALLLSISLSGCGSVGADSGAADGACDRACILGLTDSYLAALSNHDPSAVPLAGNLTFIENLEPHEPGEGLWQSATATRGAFGIHVPDPDLQQGGWIGLIERNGKPMLLALRLKLDGKRITEAEHLIAEPADLSNLAQPRQGLLATIPENRRLSHAELIRIGSAYYDAVDDNDGSLAPFAADCQRIENGLITAGPGQPPPSRAIPGREGVARDCAGQISSQAFVYIDRIENRRMVAADPVTGLVFGLSHFRQPMDNLPYKVTLADGSTAERTARTLRNPPFDLPAAHVFKIGPDARVHEIEAVAVAAPFNSPTHWE